MIPGLADRYLARNGFDSQQTDNPVGAGRPSNLFHPVPGDHGSHGIFDARASDRSGQLWADTHRGMLALLAVDIGTVVGAAVAHRRG